MRKKITTLLIILLCTFLLISCKKKEERKMNDFIKTVEKLNSYTLEGTLKSFYPSGEKECKIVVNYLKPNYYYVEITNPENNETQVIIKNNDGTYIGIPSINKTFKIKTNWPLNSSYPYILETLVNDLKKSEDLTKKIENKKTILETKVKIFDNNSSEKEKIIINKEGILEEVLIYDQDDNLINNFKVISFKKNPKLESKDFDVKEIIETIQTGLFDQKYERTITYPSYFPEGSYLVDELIKRDNDNTYAILKYGGSSSYTIVEEYLSKTDTIATSEHEGKILVFNAIPVMVAANYILFVDNGIEYKIASDKVSVFEMIKMADSLVEVSEK